MYRLPDLALLEPVLHAAIELDAAMGGNVQLYDPATRELRIAVQRGFGPGFLEYFRTVKTGDGSACAQALAERRRVVIGDTQTDPEFAPHRAVAEEAGFRSVVSTPLFARSGALLGVLSTHRTEPRASHRSGPRIEALRQLASTIIESSRLRERLEAEAKQQSRPLPVLSARSQHAALAVRELVGLMMRQGARGELVAEALRESEQLLVELGNYRDFSKIRNRL